MTISRTAVDADLWGHLRFGQDILRAASVPVVDPYSYLTAGTRWVNHEWLAEVIFAAVYDSAGSRGLIVLKSVVAMLVVGVLYIFLWRQGLTPVRSGIVVVAVVAALTPGVGTIRPQLFTYLAFSAVLLIIHGADRRHPSWIVALPIVFALWINLHGGVLAGFAVVCLWAAIQFGARGNGSDEGRSHALTSGMIAGVLLACGIALLLNPNGYRLLIFLLRTATVPRPEITEWAPLKIMSTHGISYLALLGIMCAALVFSQSPRKRTTLPILIVMAIAPLVAVRHLPLFGLAVGFSGGPLIADAWRRSKPDTPVGATARGLSLVCIAVSAFLVAIGIGNVRCIQIEGSYPIRAVELLKRSQVEGNIATQLNWGEYIIWHVGPRVKVSVDGRRETVYTDVVRLQSLWFYYGRDDWDAVLRHGTTQMALVEKQSAAGNLLHLHPDWAIAFEDEVSRLFVRRGSPQAASLERTPPPTPLSAENGARQCFP